MKKFALILIVLAVGLFFFLAQDFLSGESLCQNEILSESQNSTREFKAVVFQRDCGATTGFSTQISIIESNESLDNESGNIFVSDTNHGEAPSGPGGGPKVSIEWLSQNELKITHHPQARIFTAVSDFEKFHIQYNEIEN